MSASMNISLIPAKDDISVHLISELLGTGWWKFIADGAAPSGPGSILGSLFQIIDIALLMYVSAIMVYTAVVGGMATAHEGVPLGKRYHSVWAPIRGPATWFLLFPLPWAKGLAMIQVIMLVAVYWGIGVADDVWSGFVTEIPKYSGMIIPYQGNLEKEEKFVENALINTTIQQYIINNGKKPMVAVWLWKGDSYSGKWIYGLAPKSNPKAAGIQYGLGTISFKCSTDMTSTDAPSSSDIGTLFSDVGQTVKNVFSFETGIPVDTAQDSSACKAEKANIKEMLSGLIPYASNLTKINSASGGAAPSAKELNDIVQLYQQTQQINYAAISKFNGSQYNNQLKQFSTTASDLGWASSAYYWWTLENINSKAQSQIKALHATVNMASSKNVSNEVGKFYLPYLKAVKGLLEKYQAEQNAETRNSAMAVANIGSNHSGGNTWFGINFGKSLMQLPGTFTSGDPLADVAEFGATVKHYGEVVLGAGVIAKGVSYAAKGGASLAGKIPGVGALLKGGATVVGDAIGALANIAIPLGVMLIVEGAILQYVFPAIPGVIMMVAIVGWLFLVVELMVASVLWAAAHVYAEGEGFAPPQAQYGYSAAIGIIARPLLLTIGFIFAFFILDIGGWFLGEALQAFLTGMGAQDIGIIGYGAMMAVIIGTVLMFIKTVLKLITHLADRAPQWIGGHSGQGMGEADIAQGAVQNSGQGAQKYGMYAGDKMNSTMDSMNKSQQDRVDAAAKEDAAKLAQQRHDQTISALSGGKAAGQGGEGEGEGGEGAPKVK